MKEAPMVHWEADPSKYYMLILEDTSITTGQYYIHYLVYDIPGNDVMNGTVAMTYLPSFA